MNCPKCSGGSYVSDEEVVKILENTTPIKVILKVTYICRSCGERFSRVFSEDVEAKRKEEFRTAPGMPTSEYAARPANEPADRLRFLDRI
jgi:C4-type Zn-finger protein